MKNIYYELMIMLNSKASNEYFESKKQILEYATNMDIDSEPLLVNHGLGIVKYLLKNDKSLTGKYKLVKK